MTSQSTSGSDHSSFAGTSPSAEGEAPPARSMSRADDSGPSGRDWPVHVPRRWLFVVAGALFVAAIAYFWSVSRNYDLDLVVYRSAISWWWIGHDPYHHLYTIHHLAFTYPPFALLALGPLAAIPAGLAKFLWFLVSLVALTAAMFIVFKSLQWRGLLNLWLVACALACAAVFVIEPVRSTFDYGQVDRGDPRGLLVRHSVAEVSLARRVGRLCRRDQADTGHLRALLPYQAGCQSHRPHGHHLRRRVGPGMARPAGAFPRVLDEVRVGAGTNRKALLPGQPVVGRRRRANRAFVG